MRATITIPAETVARVRSGLFTELAHTAEEINNAVGQPGYEEAAEWYTKPLGRQDAIRALMNAVGWEIIDRPVPVTLDLYTHRDVLLSAARNDLENQAGQAENHDVPGEERATAERDRVLLEKLIAVAEGEDVMVEREPELVAFGRAIRCLRRARNVSIKDLAHEAGMSSWYLSVIEQGHGNPRLKTLYGIADALGVTLTDIVRAAAEGT